MKTALRHEAMQDRLFGVAAELRALAYLFEAQGTKVNDVAELDMDEVNHGMGRMLRRLADEVRQLWHALDEAEARFDSRRATGRR